MHVLLENLTIWYVIFHGKALSIHSTVATAGSSELEDKLSNQPFEPFGPLTALRVWQNTQGVCILVYI